MNQSERRALAGIIAYNLARSVPSHGIDLKNARCATEAIYNALLDPTPSCPCAFCTTWRTL